MKAVSRSRRNQRRNGSAFLIVMGIIGILMIAGISMTMLTGNTAFTVRKLHAGEQALATAEAGIADMIVKMSTNYVYWLDRSYSNAYSDGQYVVTTTFDTSTAHVVIHSEGTYERETRNTALQLLGTLYMLYDQTIGLDGTIVAGGDVTIETSAAEINGTVHANGNVLNNTGNPEINGDITSVGDVEITPSGGYTATSNTAPVVVPTYLPFDAWKALAQSNGIYYASDTTLPGTTLVPTNGVVYCDGDITVGNQSTLYGVLVASGNITINNRFTQYQTNTNWPCLLAGIDVNLHNRNTYTGVIFAGNDVTMANRRTLTGAVIALNNVEIANGADITPLGFYPAWDPDDTNSAPPSVIIGGWLE
jgi:hypothetical protein